MELRSWPVCIMRQMGCQRVFSVVFCFPVWFTYNMHIIVQAQAHKVSIVCWVCVWKSGCVCASSSCWCCGYCYFQRCNCMWRALYHYTTFNVRVRVLSYCFCLYHCVSRLSFVGWEKHVALTQIESVVKVICDKRQASGVILPEAWNRNMPLAEWAVAYFEGMI